MGIYEWVAAGAMGMITVILVVLLMQYIKLRDLWAGLSRCREALRWARIFESENRELKRSLNAERKRVRELQHSLSKFAEQVKAH
ncbi:hypothetical protein F3J44_14940 [Pantoea sp. Tr-811]|uniref:hypothetical protein n=1 Tax=Pantoea sp. Tr-811 TaxID=2608361 RepID=UPI00141F5867|nr:hypothetical protein [Pantoea sp. Tr-811]NIF27664.1 hypothetical protein [Pantoea sp. Tr-811]